MCSSFSAFGDEFTIEFTVIDISTGSAVASPIDLSTPVYGLIEITDDSGIPQNLDVHLVEVTADNDNLAGGEEFTLIERG